MKKESYMSKMKSKILFSLWLVTNFLLLLNIPIVIGADLVYKPSVGDSENYEVTKFQSSDKNEDDVQILANDGQRKNITFKIGLKFTVEVTAINGSVPDQDAYCIMKVAWIISKEELCSSVRLQSNEPIYLTPTVDNKTFWAEEANTISFEEISARVTDDIFEEIYSFTETDAESYWEFIEIKHTDWKTGWANYYYYRSKITFSNPDLSESDSLTEIEIKTESKIKDEEESGNVSFPINIALICVISLTGLRLKKR